MTTTMTRHVRFGASEAVLLAALACAAGCERAPPTLDLADGTMELAVTDPALLAESRTLIAAMFDAETAPCADLLDMDAATLAATSAAQAGSAAQAFTLDDDALCEQETHVFGRVEEPGRYSYLLLGSTRPCGATFADADDDLTAASGSIVAIGCRERDVALGETVHLRITMFPAGLR